MSTQRTTCWSCGESFFKSERHCPNCQADSWNPPQGPAAARSRPIMGPQTYRPAAQTGASGAAATSPVYVSAPTYDGRQTTIAAGIGILATLAAMSFWFWFAIGFHRCYQRAGLWRELSQHRAYFDRVRGSGDRHGGHMDDRARHGRRVTRS